MMEVFLILLQYQFGGCINSVVMEQVFMIFMRTKVESTQSIKTMCR